MQGKWHSSLVKLVSIGEVIPQNRFSIDSQIARLVASTFRNVVADLFNIVLYINIEDIVSINNFWLSIKIYIIIAIIYLPTRLDIWKVLQDFQYVSVSNMNIKYRANVNGWLISQVKTQKIMCTCIVQQKCNSLLCKAGCHVNWVGRGVLHVF